MRDMPRLSGVLRVAFRGSEPLDLAKESSLRDRQVRDLNKVLQTVDLGGEGQLTWQSFVADLNEPDEARMRKMRATYNLFLAELKDVLGDENMSSEELHEMAFLVYQLFSASDTSVQHKSAGLAKLLREAPAKKAVDSFASLVGTLAEWKQAVATERGGGESPLSKRMHRKEYGSHLLFSFDPPDFCSREPRQVSKTSELVVPTASTANSSSKSELVRPKANWLEDECSKLTFGFL